MAKAARKTTAAPAKMAGRKSGNAAVRQVHALERSRTPVEQQGAKKARTDLLDKSRPFETLHPGGQFHGAFYAQDGRHYDLQGHRVSVPDEDSAREEAMKRDRMARPPRMARAGDEPPADTSDLDMEDRDETGIAEVRVGEVNLSAWATGAEEYRFAQVRMAIAERFSKVVTNEVDALDFLREQKVVSREEMRQVRRGR